MSKLIAVDGDEDSAGGGGALDASSGDSSPGTVFINNKKAICGQTNSSKDGNVSDPYSIPNAGATVFIYNKAVICDGDLREGGATTIVTGQTNVYAGTNTGVELPSISFQAMTFGDDHDATDPGSGASYIASQVAAGNVSASEIASESSVVPSATDNSPPKSSGVLSTDCSDIDKLDPFPSGDAIDTIVLSTNYTVGKVTRSPHTSFDNPLRSPTAGFSVKELVCNLKLLTVNCIEPIRAHFPNIVLTNSYRPPGSNAKSQHPKGQACDMQFRGIPKSDYFVYAQWIKDNILYDQLLLEYKTTGTGMPWIHISFAQGTLRKQVLTLLNDKTYGAGLIQLS